MRIAIVGAGIAGLTCAHLLHPRHEITVFEAEDRPGGHTRTVDVETERRLQRVDTGFHRLQRPQLPGLRAGPRASRRGDRRFTGSCATSCASTARRPA